MSSNETPNWTLGPYIIQTLFLLLATALLAASVYMFLGRISLVLEAENLALLKRKWLTNVFVTGDVLSFMVIFNTRHPQDISRPLRSTADHEMSRLHDEQLPKPYERDP